MRRIFLVIAILVVLIILGLGASIYGVSSKQLDQANSDATQAAAEGIALGLSKQMDLLQELVSALAQSPEAVAAFTSANPAELDRTARRLETYLPGVLKIRLLLPTVQIPDNDTPVMGFADLQMVKDSLITSQMPAVHDQDVNQHLAVAARTLKNNLAIGVVLASISPTILSKNMQEITLHDGYLKLMQGELMLFERGNNSLKSMEGGVVSVANTRWEVHFWSEKAIDSNFQWMVAVAVLVGIALSSLSFFLAFRYFNQLLNNDCATLLKVTKDIISGKVNGSYPVNLAEIRVLISTLIQFRRVLDDDGHEKSTTALNAAKLNDFLDEPEDFGYGASAQNAPQQSTSLPGRPVALPVHEDNSNSAPLSSGSAAHGAQSGSIFKAFGIFGVIDRAITKDLIYNIGQAFGSEANTQGVKRIVMGYDGRISSPVMAEALAKGIISTGVDVLDIGITPMPVVSFVAHQTDAHSSVMITGSYNASNYNGLKMILNGETLIGENILRIKRRVDAENYTLSDLGTIERNNRCMNDYIGVISDEIHIVRPMKVVLDCANGVAGVLGPKLFKTLGCEVIELFCELDGNFPNHLPNPNRPENLGDLIAAVQHYQADVGIALDGDGGRLGVVDSKGKIICPDRLMMLFAKDVLESRADAQIIYDASCSKRLEEQIVKFGGRPVLSKAGIAFMRAKIKETGAKLAGEMSGHIFFNDNWFGFEDGFYASARLIQILSGDPRDSAELFADFPDTINTPLLVVELAEGENVGFMTALRKSFVFKDAKISEIDGLRADFADGWGLIRPAHWSPSLLLRFEAESTDALKRIQERFKAHLLRVKPDLKLPF